MQILNSFEQGSESFPFNCQNAYAKELWFKSSQRFRDQLVTGLIKGFSIKDPMLNRIQEGNAIIPILHLLDRGFTEDEILAIPEGLWRFVDENKITLKELQDAIKSCGSSSEWDLSNYLGITRRNAIKHVLSDAEYAFYDHNRKYFEEMPVEKLRKIIHYLCLHGLQNDYSLLNAFSIADDDLASKMITYGKYPFVRVVYYEVMQYLQPSNKIQLEAAFSRQMMYCNAPIKWFEFKAGKDSFIVPIYTIVCCTDAIRDIFKNYFLREVSFEVTRSRLIVCIKNCKSPLRIDPLEPLFDAFTYKLPVSEDPIVTLYAEYSRMHSLKNADNIKPDFDFYFVTATIMLLSIALNDSYLQLLEHCIDDQKIVIFALNKVIPLGNALLRLLCLVAHRSVDLPEQAYDKLTTIISIDGISYDLMDVLQDDNAIIVEAFTKGKDFKWEDRHNNA